MNPDFIKAYAEAMAIMEGFYKKGTISAINNNPGNLRAYKSSQPTNKGYRMFPTVDAGWKSLFAQIRLNISLGVNSYTFFAGQRDETGEVIPGGYPGYAPAADSNHPKNYAEFVASKVGIDPNAKLADIIKTWKPKEQTSAV